MRRPQHEHPEFDLDSAYTAPNSPRSTSDSLRGPWVCAAITCDTPTTAPVGPGDGRLDDHSTVFLDQALPHAPPGMRCFLGAFKSSRSQPVMMSIHGPSTGRSRSVGFRGDGVAHDTAAYTVRRCTLCTLASSQIDIPLFLESRRIPSNNSTLDLTFQPVPFSPWLMSKRYKSGRGWGISGWADASERRVPQAHPN